MPIFHRRTDVRERSSDTDPPPRKPLIQSNAVALVVTWIVIFLMTLASCYFALPHWAA